MCWILGRVQWAFVLALGLATVWLIPRPSWALDGPVLGPSPLTIDVSNTLRFNSMFDNRNTVPFRPGTVVDDNRSEVIDRLNLQLSWWRLRFGMRFDVALYLGQMSREDSNQAARKEIEAAQAKGVPAPTITDYSNQFVRELNTRYLNTAYPSKIWLEWGHKGWEVTAGDFYVQLGRGLVFSVRKIDEFAIDTTVRGGRVSFDKTLSKVHLQALFFAGQMNPLRLDEMSGRRLHGPDSPLFFGFPAAQVLTTFSNDVDVFGTPKLVAVVDSLRPSYLPDTALGGKIAVGFKGVELAVHAAGILRENHTVEALRCQASIPVACGAFAQGTPAYGDCVRKQTDLCTSRAPDFSSNSPSLRRNQIRNLSGSLSIPSIGRNNGDLYFEVAGQQALEGRPTGVDAQGVPTNPDKDITGLAFYGNTNVRAGIFAGSFEFKHYRGYLPLSGNIDGNTPGFGAAEFTNVTYNQVPTAEAIYVQPTGQPNLCITGGRGRADARPSKGVGLFLWAGHFVSHSELDAANVACEEKEEKRTNTWDLAAGLDTQLEKGKTFGKVWFGARTTDRAVPIIPVSSTAGEPSSVFYREGYVRYDVQKHIGGPFAVQLTGWHRARYAPDEFQNAWFEGENYTSVQWSPHWIASVGVEYLSRPGCQPGSPDYPCMFFNGQLQYRAGSPDTMFKRIVNAARLYVGQRRGALRCISGVCRLFPPLEGVQLEMASRF